MSSSHGFLIQRDEIFSIEVQSWSFIFISLFSGVLAEIILVGVNYFVTEPFIEAIGIEVENSIVAGEVVDYEELNTYRIWQKEGTFAAGDFPGLTYGGILGILFIVLRKYLPSSSNKNEAIALVVIICISLYVVPLIEYPVNISTVGDHDNRSKG